LKISPTAFPAYIHDNLSPTTALNDPAHTNLKDIVKDVNMLLLGPAFMMPDRFKNVTLRPETHQLARPGARRRRFGRLNRMLLEDAFPTEIVRKPVTPPNSNPGWLGDIG